jgi:hypothetical protein
MEERIARLQAMASTQGSAPAPSAPMPARAGGSVPKTGGRGPWG